MIPSEPIGQFISCTHSLITQLPICFLVGSVVTANGNKTRTESVCQIWSSTDEGTPFRQGIHYLIFPTT